MRSFKQSCERGFTLVEVLIAAGIGLVVLLAISQMFVVHATTMSNAEKAFSAADALNEMRNMLASPNRCTGNMIGLPFGMGRDAATNDLSEIEPGLPLRKKPNGEVFKVGTPYGGIGIKSMKMSALQLVKPSFFASEFTVTFQTTAPKSTNDTSGEIERKIAMMVQTENGSILKCWAKDAAGMASMNKACEGVSGGVLNWYDEQLDECSIANTKWVPGNVNSASCPPGSRVRTGADTMNDCKILPPAGFVDPITSVDFTLTDGSISQNRRAPFMATLIAPTNSCMCDHAVDIGSTAGFQCQVRCLFP
jgi:prepilin-type N-terminal cleavage/methylation domain-containing protein